MIKKKKTNKKINKKKITTLSSEADYILTLIKYTKRSVQNDGSKADAFMIKQLDSLNRKLKEVS